MGLRYMIVSGENLLELEKKVNNCISMGFKPNGSLYTIQDPKRFMWEFCQTMYRSWIKDILEGMRYRIGLRKEVK